MAKELSDISGIGPSTEESLNEAGIQSIDDLANATIETLSSCGMSNSRAKDIKHEAKQSTITIQSASDVENEYNNRRTIPSGINTLDEYIEGGLSDSEIVASYGPHSSGKTQLAFQLAVSAVENDGGPVIYIETERERFQPQRIKDISSDEDVLDDIYRIKAYDLDSQYNSYNKVKDSFNEVSLIIIDSLTARFRLTDKFDGRAKLSERSSELGKHINAIENMVDYFNCPCYVTCQIYGSPTQFSSGHSMYGGELLKHSIIYRFYLKQSTGDTHEITVESHPSTGDNSFHVMIDENGFNEV